LAERIEVEVREDKIHGSIAEITIKAAHGISTDEIQKRVEDILARYTVKYSLKIQQD
jgi:fatty-acyl-CoA synthase